MPVPEEPLHDLVRGDDEMTAHRAPTSPRVTPEPAPSDTALVTLSVATGVAATLLLLAMWHWWRDRRRR